MVFISPDHKALFFLGGCVLGGVRLTSHKHVVFLRGFPFHPSPPQKKVKGNRPGSRLYWAAFTKCFYSHIFDIDTYNKEKFN